jgi:hypothetical protein
MSWPLAGHPGGRKLYDTDGLRLRNGSQCFRKSQVLLQRNKTLLSSRTLAVLNAVFLKSEEPIEALGLILLIWRLIEGKLQYYLEQTDQASVLGAGCKTQPSSATRYDCHPALRRDLRKGMPSHQAETRGIEYFETSRGAGTIIRLESF